MSRVVYNDKRIIPAPLINITKTYQKSGNGDIIGKLYTITVTGTIVAYMGSPTHEGVWWEAGGYPDDEDIPADERLAAIFRKQEALRTLFADEGQEFYAQSADSSASLRCYPRVNSISFAEDIWYSRCNYTIELEADVLYGLIHEEQFEKDNFTQYISDASEQWTIDNNEEALNLQGAITYALSHTVSAVGKKFFDETGQPHEPWEYAQQYVLDRLGFDQDMALGSGVMNLPSYYNGLNHVRSEQIDKAGGSFSVTESWVLSSGTAIEDFTIRQSSAFEDPYTNVIIEGNVRGYEEKDSDFNVTSTKWDNAQTKFAFVSGVALARAQQYSGLTLNIEPMNFTIARNPFQGTIDYTYEYNTRPSNLIENAKSEVISIQDNIGGELFASVFVLGRTAGPVLQDLGTKPANTRALSIEIVVDPPTYSTRTVDVIKGLMYDQKPSVYIAYSGDIANVIEAANPSNIGGTTIFQDQPQETWDFKNGRYSYNATWTYE
jgi:hypothetical protein